LTIAIVPAALDDLPTIVRMAGALSRQDGDPDVNFTLERAADDLLGPAPWVFGLVANLDGARAGMLLWHYAYETAYAARGGFIVSLWVDEAYRRQGVARSLIAAAANRIKADGGDYLWWASKPRNGRAHAAYAAIGAGSEPVIAHALTGDRFARLARMDGLGRTTAHDRRSEMLP
jgi:ribosomal protein S18 acetylase RimI-like enzyme